MKTVKIGTRGSLLAVRQTELAAALLTDRHPGWRFEIVTIKTTGDIILDRTFEKIGGKGLFTKEIERALLSHEIDMAVHSMKDMPVDITPGLTIAAVTEREDPSDVFVGKNGCAFADLRQNAIVGTSSLRRKTQLLALRPDLQIVPVRGNIVTRIGKLDDGLDGIVLAAAGLSRVGLMDKATSAFTLQEMVPAAAQGILALQTRADDTEMINLCRSVNHRSTEICAAAERSFLSRIGGDCHTPVGALAATRGGLSMTAFFYDGAPFRAEAVGDPDDPEALGRQLGDIIFMQCQRQ